MSTEPSSGDGQSPVDVDSGQSNLAPSTEVPVPNTLAGQILRAWLDAFNSNDRARIQAFIQKFAPEQSVDMLIQFRASIGRIDLLSITKSDRTRIEFQVKQLTSPKTAMGELDVADAVPPQMIAMNFRGLQVLPPSKN